MPEQNQVVATWLTYEPSTSQALTLEGDKQRWIIGIGDIIDNQVTLDMQVSDGGQFNADTAHQTRSIGSASIEFTSCNEATVNYNFDWRGEELQQGTVNLNKLLPSILCN